MTPLVSAIIPAYNAERYLAAAILSVLAQTYPRMEIVVVDDGSTDHTADIAASFGTAVRYIRQPNQGVSVARNRGMTEARGEYLAFLDADDEWLPRKIEVQVARLEARPSAAASFTGKVYVDERRGIETVEMLHLEPDMVGSLLLVSGFVGPPSALLVRRDTLLELGGFDTHLSQSADQDLWIRLAEVGPLDVVDEALVRYRLHEKNMSRNVRLLEADTMRWLARFFEVPAHRERYGSQRGRIYGRHLMILAGSYLHAGALPQSVRCLAAAIGDHPPNALDALRLSVRILRRMMARARSTDHRDSNLAS